MTSFLYFASISLNQRAKSLEDFLSYMTEEDLAAIKAVEDEQGVRAKKSR